MGLIVGDIVTLRHYSGTIPFKTIINEVNGDYITIKLTRDFGTLNFFEGDPIVLFYDIQSSIYTASCSISKISLKQNTITLKISYSELLTDKRKGERFAVSLYSDIRIKGASKKDIAIVKNMSSEGILVCTKADFNLEQELEIDLYIEKTLIFLKAEVIWKLSTPNNFEYGLSIFYPSLQVRNLVRRHLQMLKDEQEKFIRELKGITT